MICLEDGYSLSPTVSKLICLKVRERTDKEGVKTEEAVQFLKFWQLVWGARKTIINQL